MGQMVGQMLGGARVLVTGASGFVGQYASGALSASGAEVVQISKKTGFDLRNEAEALVAILKGRPNIVLHLAASRATSPAWKLKDDLSIHMNVVHASALAEAKMVTLFSDAIYDDEASGSAAQKALLSLMMAHHEQFGMRYSALVAQRAYGAGDDLVSTMARIFLKASADKASVIEITPRDNHLVLLHALDLSKAIVHACTALDDTQPVDLPGEAVEFEGLVKIMVEKTGYQGKVTLNGNHEANGHRPPLDGTRAGSSLFWTPETSLEDGVAQTVEWCKQTAGGGTS